MLVSGAFMRRDRSSRRRYPRASGSAGERTTQAENLSEWVDAFYGCQRASGGRIDCADGAEQPIV